MLDRLIGNHCRVLSWFMVLSLGLMVLLLFINAVLCCAFHTGIAASNDLFRCLFVWTTFMGAIVALRELAHLGTDTTVAGLSP